MGRLYGSLDPFSHDEYDRLHKGTLRVLKSVGCYVDSVEMLEYAKEAGHDVDSEKKVVKFKSDVVEHNLYHCPNSLDRRRPPATLIFSCDGGGGYVLDYGQRKKRAATVEDIQNFCRVADALENIDEISFPVYPRNLPYEIQDLTIWRHVWANTSKEGGGGLSRNGFVWMNTQPEAIRLLLRLAEVKYGAKRRPNGNPLIGGFVGAASPLRFDNDMMTTMLELIRLEQTVCIGSNVIGGAQGPASLAGVVVMENAERLAALSLAMAADDHVTIQFCNHPNYLDMTTANVANGSPEHSLMAMCGTGLLRHYGFQLLSNHPAIPPSAQIPGSQASAEKTAHAFLTGLSGASGICTCGALNETMSLEQLVIDNEIAGMIRRYLRGLEINDETMALDLIEKVGIGGNFLEEPEVAQQARATFWQPQLWNRYRFVEWERQGSRDIMEKAHDVVQRILAEHHPKPLSDEQEREMDALLEEARATLLRAK